jgi:chromosome partitioning protein
MKGEAMGLFYGFVLGKGGIGKTTTTQNVMAGFEIMERTGWKYKGGVVPAIDPDIPAANCGVDLDPQKNLSRGSGVILDEQDPSAHEVLLNPDYGIGYVVKRAPAGYDLVPSASNMDNIEQELNNDQVIGRDLLLNVALRQAEGSAEYEIPWQAIDKYRLFGDTPRNLGILTINVLVAADVILVPYQPEIYADDALDQLEARIKQVRKIKRSIEIGGIIVTMYDARLTLHQELVKKVRKRFGEKVFKTMIPRNVRVAEAPAFGQSIFEYDPSSPGAKAHLELVKEIKARYE